MKTKKAMISQPMNGLTYDEIMKDRKEAIEWAESHGFEVLNTVYKEFTEGEEVNPALFYLSKSIETLAKVNLVIFIDGWQSARGCQTEQYICTMYGIENTNFWRGRVEY